VGLVVRDREGRGIQVCPVEPVDGQRFLAEAARRLEARVAGDDLAGALGHDRMSPAETPDRGGHVRHGLIVDARVGGAEEAARGRPPVTLTRSNFRP
jgi:hypothetical protein